jgi:hypothetical protein
MWHRLPEDQHPLNQLPTDFYFSSSRSSRGQGVDFNKGDWGDDA